MVILNELRKDPVTRRWVIISSERSKRPNNYHYDEAINDIFCPFDYGNENSTPEEIFSIRKDSTQKNKSGWNLRVVPNKFPALTTEQNFLKSGHGMYDKTSAYGYHEVIIETPEHNTSFALMKKEQISLVIKGYIERYNEIKKDKSIKYIQIFKNSGKRAGASLVHPHSQLIATPIVPYTIYEELKGAEEYFKFKDRCVFCDMIHQEIFEKSRIIMKTKNFICFAPYASRFPYELMILPIEHNEDFGSLKGKDSEIDEISEIFSHVFRKFRDILGNPSYNLVLHTAPFVNNVSDYYHWHFEIIPRTTNIAGFEWGTGFYINTVPPEQTALDLNYKEDII